MIQLKYRLASAARTGRVPLEVVEKDYLISYVLAGMSTDDALGTSLILKGGTALRKLHFQDYRFSEDLDFSAAGAPEGERLEAGIRRVAGTAEGLLSGYGPFGIDVQRYEEREPHPHGQEAFILRARFPWQRDALCRIKIEITSDEPVLLPPERRPLLHGYGEDLQCLVSCYALEEIVAEKLRTLLQTHQKLATRGWNRPRARDYYDLWHILRSRGGQLRTELIADLLRTKADHRQVTWHTVDDFFTAELAGEAMRTWNQTLGPFVADLPECEPVLRELKVRLTPLLH